MTQSDQPVIERPWKVWPRTAEGRCSCPYCTAHREGRLPTPEIRDDQSDWLRRMGGMPR